MKVRVCSPNRDTDIFDIVPGVLQGDKFSPYFLITYLDYVLRTPTDQMKENSFTLKIATSKQYPAETKNRRRLYRWSSASPSLPPFIFSSSWGSSEWSFPASRIPFDNCASLPAFCELCNLFGPAKFLLSVHRDHAFHIVPLPNYLASILSAWIFL